MKLLRTMSPHRLVRGETSQLVQASLSTETLVESTVPAKPSKRQVQR